MSNDVFYPPTIEDQAIGNIEPSGTNSSGRTDTTTYKPLEEVDKKFPSTVLAHETIGKSLDTRTKKIKSEFTFGKYGAIKIGEYEFGVSGETLLSPNGITTKNINGEQTIAIDGTDGSIVLKATLAAGSLIAGDFFTVKEENNRKGMFISDTTHDLIFIGIKTS